MKDTIYYSTDKMYRIKKFLISNKALLTLCIISTIILLILSTISFKLSTKINAKNSDIKYNEIGKVDYKVYLKDNDYYESSYLNSGMQYVASLIKTVNVNFNYQMHTTKDIAFNSKYKVTGELKITERDEPTKVLYTKKEELIPSKTVNIKDDNFVINEELDIDYDKYNNIVNLYKSNLGLIVSSNLILTLETETNGTYEKDSLNKNNKLQITIPLSESTLQIKMDSNEINNSGSIGIAIKPFIVNNVQLFIICILLILLTIVNIIIDIHIYIKYFQKDVYKSKVNKILRDYDRLIVNGKINIDEKAIDKVIIIQDFKELVDAAQNLNLPILFYEAIPNEKCFFVVIADRVLYKYRLTKAYLERHQDNKENNSDKFLVNNELNKKKEKSDEKDVI